MLSSFSEQIRLVLNNVRLLDQFTQRYLETLKALNKSVDVRDPTTASHTERVTAVAVEIARKMGLSVHEVGVTRTAAEIHDVGMCGITEVARGFQADYNHPTIGADMIRILALPPGVADAIASHHEWFDGWGYPNGLKGNEITLGGRILALAEYFVEMTTVSEFQPPITWSKLKEEIEVRRGTQFDPTVVDALVILAEEKRTQSESGVPDGCIAFKADPSKLQTETILCFRPVPEAPDQAPCCTWSDKNA
jgi:putative nucleotidyltransferase with HDIG domain